MFLSVARRRKAAATAVVSGLALAGLGIFATAASAHDVTGVDANCSTVTVHFANFPTAAVLVHIDVQVGAEPAILDDVPVDKNTSDVAINISAATAGLMGASAAVDVDITWTNF